MYIMWFRSLGIKTYKKPSILYHLWCFVLETLGVPHGPPRLTPDLDVVSFSIFMPFRGGPQLRSLGVQRGHIWRKGWYFSRDICRKKLRIFVNTNEDAQFNQVWDMSKLRSLSTWCIPLLRLGNCRAWFFCRAYKPNCDPDILVKHVMHYVWRYASKIYSDAFGTSDIPQHQMLPTGMRKVGLLDFAAGKIWRETVPCPALPSTEPTPVSELLPTCSQKILWLADATGNPPSPKAKTCCVPWINGLVSGKKSSPETPPPSRPAGTVPPRTSWACTPINSKEFANN